MVQSILILGGGSAGLIAALSLRAKLPDIPITVVRSVAMGVIGVGEGTTLSVPGYFHQTLGLNRAEFFRAVDPSYKRGVRFLWGPRDHYDYGFGNNLALKLQGLSKPFGYYCDKDLSHTNPVASLMTHGRFFLRGADGNRVDDSFLGYHFENARLVAYLESAAAARGITLVDDELAEAPVDDTGVLELRLVSGRSMRADLYVDASGFRAELLGRALGEPFVSFKSSLFCERAVVGGWERTTEPVLPYTTSETMEAGWCWQIEHRTRINRGYVYAPDFISDAQAEEEFRWKNPKVTKTRVVKFVSGRRENAWVKNVVAVGNAGGFVEPLEATSLGMICEQSENLAGCLAENHGAPTGSSVALYNLNTAASWDMIRWFLAAHYKFNTRLDTPFWQAARAHTDVGAAGPLLDFYAENGPSLLARPLVPQPIDTFGLDGYLIHLVGMRAPHRQQRPPGAQELEIWNRHRTRVAQAAANGVRFEELSAPSKGANGFPSHAFNGDPR